MNQKEFLIRGTFLLTAAGILTRLLGFFYKIFLSRVIGAEGIGIFHLILPVHLFCSAIASGGIQTAVSRFCAEYCVRKERRQAEQILTAGLAVSVTLSVLTAYALYQYADVIAVSFLAEARCGQLLRITAFSLPFSVIHACLCGYFIGVKQIRIPAAAQLAEQLVRIGTVLCLYGMVQRQERALSPGAMAVGQVTGELASSLLCTFCYMGRACRCEKSDRVSDAQAEQRFKSAPSLWVMCRRLLAVSSPLALNRMLLCVLQGVEAALLPQQLVRSGLLSRDALSLYGTLSGMALPMLLFPTAITGALGVLLLPVVSEARVLCRRSQLSRTMEGSFFVSFLLGVFCFGIFALFGTSLGPVLFHSRTAGKYIARLAWLCPFMYLNTTLTSILHGLGKTFAVSWQSVLGFLCRLAAVCFLVPVYGIDGYFPGLFAAQLLVFTAALCTLHRCEPLHLPWTRMFLQPLAACMLAICGFRLLRSAAPYLRESSWGALMLGGSGFTLIFASSLYLMQKYSHKEPPQEASRGGT